MRLFFTFVPNWHCVELSLGSEECVHVSAVFAFEADDCVRLVG